MKEHRDLRKRLKNRCEEMRKRARESDVSELVWGFDATFGEESDWYNSPIADVDYYNWKDLEFEILSWISIFHNMEKFLREPESYMPRVFREDNNDADERVDSIEVWFRGVLVYKEMFIEGEKEQIICEYHPGEWEDYLLERLEKRYDNFGPKDD